MGDPRRLVLGASVVPGLGHLLLGRRGRGLALLGVIVALAAVAVFRWEAVQAAWASAEVGSWVASRFLFAALAATVVASAWDAWRMVRDAGTGDADRPGATRPGRPGAGRPPRRWSDRPTDLRELRAAVEAAREEKRRTEGKRPLRVARRRFAENRLAVAAAWVIVGMGLCGVLAPVLAPHDPTAIENVLETRYLAPSLEHPFGTDEFGRDLLSRALFGARVSLSVGFLAVMIAVSFGTVYGAVAGYFGGVVDNVLMRLVDVILAFPTFFLMLTLVGVFEASLVFLVLILGFTSWTGTARYIRGEILSLKEREFVEGARSIGLPHRLILFRHLIPNALAPVLVSAALMVGGMVGAEAGLSFLGIGIRPPTPSWGNMIAQGQDALLVAWWVAFFPGSLLALTILSFNLLADGLRDALDPKTLMRKYV